jgi:phosphatidylglycerophosphate synthase
MREVCQQRRPNAKGEMVWAGHWFNRLVTRRYSIYLTWFFVRLYVSANVVTFLMILIGLLGFALCIPHVLWMTIAGGILLLLGETLDCVDGEVSRWSNSSSLKGLYLDLVNHVLTNAAASSICALHLFALYRDDKYFILAFLAYAMAQIRLGLREEWKVIRSQITHDAKPAEGGAKGGTPPIRGVTAARTAALGRWLLHMAIDDWLLRIAGVIAAVAVILAWYFVIFGFVHNVGDIANKYFGLVPNTKHTKKV